MQYLTEAKLEIILSKIYPNASFTRDKIVPNSGAKFRPDFVSNDLMLIVEFDGDRHFTQTKTQKNDTLKTVLYEEMGYKIIRIPYFVQMTTQSIKYYFDVDYEIDQLYPHGFIDAKCTLPADFNTLGIRAFRNILHDLPNNIQDDIITSLLDKILIDKNDILHVLPVSIKPEEYIILRDHIIELGSSEYTEDSVQRYQDILFN